MTRGSSRDNNSMRTIWNNYAQKLLSQKRELGENVNRKFPTKSLDYVNSLLQPVAGVPANQIETVYDRDPRKRLIQEANMTGVHDKLREAWVVSLKFFDQLPYDIIGPKNRLDYGGPSKLPDGDHGFVSNFVLTLQWLVICRTNDVRPWPLRHETTDAFLVAMQEEVVKNGEIRRSCRSSYREIRQKVENRFAATRPSEFQRLFRAIEDAMVAERTILPRQSTTSPIEDWKPYRVELNDLDVLERVLNESMGPSGLPSPVSVDMCKHMYVDQATPNLVPSGLWHFPNLLEKLVQRWISEELLSPRHRSESASVQDVDMRDNHSRRGDERRDRGSGDYYEPFRGQHDSQRGRSRHPGPSIQACRSRRSRSPRRQSRDPIDSSHYSSRRSRSPTKRRGEDHSRHDPRVPAGFSHYSPQRRLSRNDGNGVDFYRNSEPDDSKMGHEIATTSLHSNADEKGIMKSPDELDELIRQARMGVGVSAPVRVPTFTPGSDRRGLPAPAAISRPSLANPIKLALRGRYATPATPATIGPNEARQPAALGQAKREDGEQGGGDRSPWIRGRLTPYLATPE